MSEIAIYRVPRFASLRRLWCRFRGHDDHVLHRVADRWTTTTWRVCERCGRVSVGSMLTVAGMDRLVKDSYAPALRAMLAEPSPFLRYLATSTDTPTLTPAERAERAALRERRRALAQVLADIADEWDVRSALLELLDEDDWS